MFDEHIPRLFKALILFFVAAAVIVAAVYFYAPEYLLLAVVLLGIALLGFAAFEIGLIAYQNGNRRMEILNERVRLVTYCPPDRLNALGMRVPELGLHIISGLPVPMWSLDPPITLAEFRDFLADCTDDYIVPVRADRSIEGAQRRELILRVLLKRGYVVTHAEGGSPRGPRSWLFRQGANARLWAEWMSWDIQFVAYGQADQPQRD